MRRAGMLLQERVAQEQRQQKAVPARRQTAITEELSTERQARRMAERRVAELEQQMAKMRPPAQELEQRQNFRGQQAAPMFPRPLQVGANAQWQTMGLQRQMAPPACAQVAQMPPNQAVPQQVAPRQAAPRSVEMTRRRHEITQGKRAALVPQAAGASRTAPRAQAAPILMSDLQTGPESAGMSHLPDDLRRYVSLLLRQYVDKRPRPMATDGPTTDSPVLDTDMLEEDRLAWQQLAAGMRRTPDGGPPNAG